MPPFHDVPLSLAIDGSNIALTAVLLGGFIAIISIVSGSLSRMRQTRHREESRREIAAYVAEGSLSPDDAVRLINAGGKAPARDERATS